MRRLLVIPFVCALLIAPVSAEAGSELRLRGTVVHKEPATGLVTVVSGRLQHVLRVPGSLERIRVGFRVELRGTTLRRHGDGSRVLARGVLIVGSVLVDRTRRDDRADEQDDDEREVRGAITSLAPLAVAGATCAVPPGISLRGFLVGDVVEITCDLVRGVWTLRKIHLEDDDVVRDEDRRDDHDDDGGGGSSGPGGGDDDNSGTGRG